VDQCEQLRMSYLAGDAKIGKIVADKEAADRKVLVVLLSGQWNLSRCPVRCRGKNMSTVISCRGVLSRLAGSTRFDDTI
jgi:hypothetical protein